jgi:hypothetical protein
MSQALSITLCDAVVTALNAATFSEPFQAVRYYQPKFTLEDLEELKVCVVPISKAKSNLSRSTDSIETVIQVGVLKKLDSVENADLDVLTGLVEEIETFCNDLELIVNPVSTIVGTAINPIFDEKLLNDNRQFTSVIELTVRSYQ